MANGPKSGPPPLAPFVAVTTRDGVRRLHVDGIESMEDVTDIPFDPAVRWEARTRIAYRYGLSPTSQGVKEILVSEVKAALENEIARARRG